MAKYLRTTHQGITMRVAVAFLDHGPFCNPQVWPPIMSTGDDEITNNRLMCFSPRPVQLYEKSHPLWGFRGRVIDAEQTGIFPLKWLTAWKNANSRYDDLVFPLIRTLYGKCTRYCHWLLEHDCAQGSCILPPFPKGLCICSPCRTNFGYRVSQ